MIDKASLLAEGDDDMLGVQITELGRVHADGRRVICESDLPQAFGLLRITWIGVTEDEPQQLGGHHHDVMTELFYLTSGTVERLVVSRGKEVESFQHIKAPALILMPTGVDHTFILAPGSVMNSLSDVPFDQNDIIGAPAAHKAAVA